MLDMLVALSYPEAFAIKPSPTMTGELAIGGGGDGGTVFLSASPFLVGGSILDACNPYYTGLSLYGWDGCSPVRVLRVRGTAFLLTVTTAAGGTRRAVAAGSSSAPIVPPSRHRAHGQVVNGRGYMSRRFRGIEREQQLGRRLVVRIVRLLRRWRWRVEFELRRRSHGCAALSGRIASTASPGRAVRMTEARAGTFEACFVILD